MRGARPRVWGLARRPTSEFSKFACMRTCGICSETPPPVRSSLAADVCRRHHPDSACQLMPSFPTIVRTASTSSTIHVQKQPADDVWRMSAQPPGTPILALPPLQLPPDARREPPVCQHSAMPSVPQPDLSNLCRAVNTGAAWSQGCTRTALATITCRPTRRQAAPIGLLSPSDQHAPASCRMGSACARRP